MKKYDAVVIGAGMSGLACAIKLSMLGKSVRLLEKHSIEGGLNSYYYRKGHEIEVGLHALTNFANKGARNCPLAMILKQLRINYEEIAPISQKETHIRSCETTLAFSNNIELLINEITLKFPHEIENFFKLIKKVEESRFEDVGNEFISGRQVLKTYIKDELLCEMLLLPLLYYGSSHEDDIDLRQLIIMFKSVYLEGLFRPTGGVRTILNILLQRLAANNVELSFNSEVTAIKYCDDGLHFIEIDSEDEKITADHYFSSIGAVETNKLLGIEDPTIKPGSFGFIEVILIPEQSIEEIAPTHTITFYQEENENYPRALYRCPDAPYEERSGIICFPNNFEKNDLSSNQIKHSHLANPYFWEQLKESDKKKYGDIKNKIINECIERTKKLYPKFNGKITYSDMFTPSTIKRYTGKINGAIYGSPIKSHSGETKFSNLSLIGTDQGFVGVTGTILSGITAAHRYLQKSQLQ